MASLNLENSLIDHRYLIQWRIRSGHYTELFLGRDRISQETVIIKTMSLGRKGRPDHAFEQRLVQYFQTEAEVLDRLRHPHIIRRLGHGTAADLDRRIFYYLVLEYMAGGDLMGVCRRGPLPLARALDYCHQVCLGLGYAHQHGIIHRDIKPQNLLLDATRRQVKISDFGIAKVLRGADEEFTRGIGTETYAPPEYFGHQQAGAALTPAADIYSLAKTLYVMLTGTPPREFFQSPIPHLPAALRMQPWAPAMAQILHRATQHDPRQRYATADAFWHELQEVGRVSGSLDLSQVDEETVIADNVGQARFSQPAEVDSIASAVRVEVPIGFRLGRSERAVPAPPPAGGVAEPQPGTAAGPLVQRWTRRLFVTALAAGFIAGAFWVHSVFSGGGGRIRHGVVMAENLNLRAGPGESFSSYGWIPRGTRVEILRPSRSGRWLEVEAPYWDWGDRAVRRRQGWVSRTYIKLEEEGP